MYFAVLGRVGFPRRSAALQKTAGRQSTKPDPLDAVLERGGSEVAGRGQAARPDPQGLALEQLTEEGLGRDNDGRVTGETIGRDIREIHHDLERVLGPGLGLEVREGGG